MIQICTWRHTPCMLTEALDETDDTSPAPFSWHFHCVNNEWRWVKLQNQREREGMRGELQSILKCKKYSCHDWKMKSDPCWRLAGLIIHVFHHRCRCYNNTGLAAGGCSRSWNRAPFFSKCQVGKVQDSCVMSARKLSWQLCLITNPNQSGQHGVSRVQQSHRQSKSVAKPAAFGLQVL